MDKASIGVIGLAVMGRNLALNIERNGFTVAVYNRSPEKTKDLIETEGKNKKIIDVYSLEALMEVLEKPRRILMMVQAGQGVDSVIAQLRPLLETGDILIDGGNSFFLDTERRNKDFEKDGFNYVGMGVSGGEEGALWGPSIMPGGQKQAWEALRPILRAMSAKAEEDGQPCVEYIGPRGAGHFVKMVHNGIEYGDMQLIAEVYDVLTRGLGLQAKELAQIFAEWNQGELRSYLIQITSEILGKVDPDTGKPLVEMILDEAQQKGTGKWTSQNALDIGAPTPTINAAVESRIISSLKPQRVVANKVIHGPQPLFRGNNQQLIDAARQALYASKITSYAQGLGMMRIASGEYNYDLQMGEIAKIWRAGCIIRASLLGDITKAYERKPDLVNLLLDDFFRTTVESRQEAWRFFVQSAVGMGIPVLATNASLSYFDAYRTERLPANLTQGQRDYFGAHTYRRIDKDGIFHTEWTK
jgi:6-phosphogluconate dehydrogenase